MPDLKDLFFCLMTGENKWDYFLCGFCSSHQFWMSKGEDVADCKSVFSHSFLFVLPVKIVGLLTVDHVIDAAAIVVVLY